MVRGLDMKSVEIWFCFSNVRRNVGIDTKLLDCLSRRDSEKL